MPPALRERALRIVGQEPAREGERRLLLRVRAAFFGIDRVPVADHRAARRRCGRAGSGTRLELADDRRLRRILEARERRE